MRERSSKESFACAIYNKIAPNASDKRTEFTVHLTTKCNMWRTSFRECTKYGVAFRNMGEAATAGRGR